MTRLRSDLQQTFRWSVFMPAADMEHLAQLHPVSGINTAIVIYGLEELRRRIETRPDLCALIREEVTRTRESKLAEPQIKQLCVRVPIELATRYTAIIPEMGAVAWLMRRLIYTYMDRATPLCDQITSDVDSLLQTMKPAPATSFRAPADDE